MSEQPYFDASQGSIWIQPDGPNTQPQFLGCHDIADVVQPQGDISQRYCNKRTVKAGWDPVLESQAPPGRVTTSITTYVGKTADWLQKVRCPVPIYIHLSTCGRRDTFLNYDAGNLLYWARITNKTKTNLAKREGSDGTEQTFELSGRPPLAEYWPLRMSRLTTTEAQDARDVAHCGEEYCTGACGPSEEVCDDLLIGAASAAGPATANVLYSNDGGTTLTAMAVDPFGAGEHVSSVVCVSIGRDTLRQIAARGLTDAGNPAEIAYTDNNGASWTNVNVGSTNGEFIPWNGGLFALDAYHIWCGTDLGHIFFSGDGGVTWTLQTTLADDVNCIHFIDYNTGFAVGNTNAMQLTTDAGTSWSTLTGPAAQVAANAMSCRCHDAYRLFVCYADGELWYSTDGGDTWTQRVLPLPAGGTALNRVNAMDWLDDFFGCLAIKYTATADVMGAIYRTFDGGYSWETYPTDEPFDVGAIGMASVVMCDKNLAYGVGDICGATATVYKLSL